MMGMNMNMSMNMNMGMNMGPGSVPEPCGPSPGLNRMTPGNPMPPQMVPGPSPSGSGGQMMASGPPSVSSMPGPGPSPRPGPPQGSSAGSGSGWQGGGANVNYGVGSPAGQPCYVQGPASVQSANNQVNPEMSAMMMAERSLIDVKSSPANGAATHPDDYLLPNFNSQDNNEQNESAEIMKVKQSLQDETKKYEQEKSEFEMNFGEPQNKWNNM